MDERKGNQNPTVSRVLEYKETKGQEAVDLYNSTGKTAEDWQKLLLFDLLAVRDDGLWTHEYFGYSVPRRNGKTEVVTMRELHGLVNGERILHTAHLTDTAHTAYERLLELCEEAKLPIKSRYRAFGKEHIYIDGGGKAEFRTRTSRGGLGTGYDTLVIDEAQEYKDDQDSTLKYVVSDSRNPQTIYLGTPPTAVSAGTVFVNYRNDVLSGAKEDAAWEEWSVERMTDVHDREAWYLTNPSIGYRLTERKIAAEIGRDDVDFNIQRLGLWIKYNQHSAITKKDWEASFVSQLPQLVGGMYFGIKYGHDNKYVSMSVAINTADDRVFVECIDTRPIREGTAWMVAYLQKAAPGTIKVLVDGANGQMLLAKDMKTEKMKAPTLPTTKDIILANSTFEKALYGNGICHAGQPSLMQSATNVEKRAIGSNGGFGYRSIRDGTDVSLLDSAILAFWAAKDGGTERKKQKVSF